MPVTRNQIYPNINNPYIIVIIGKRTADQKLKGAIFIYATSGKLGTTRTFTISPTLFSSTNFESNSHVGPNI